MGDQKTGQADNGSLVVRGAEIAPVDRGTGVVTFPYVGKWNTGENAVTSGVTVFEPGMGIPLHSHNVEETVLVLEGEARAVIGDQEYDLVAGDATKAAAGVPHRYTNRGSGQMRIFWAYGGRDVTRTMTESGVTVEHLSAEDRGAVSG